MGRMYQLGNIDLHKSVRISEPGVGAKTKKKTIEVKKTKQLIEFR